MPRRYYTWLFVLLVSVETLAQQKTCIIGEVKDKKTGEVLIGANIYLKNLFKGVATDVLGSFEICVDSLKNTDTLLISYTGYETIKQLITVTTKTVQFIFELSLSRNATLQEVRITGRLPIAESFVVQKLSYLDIVLNPAASADPLLAVRSLPSSTTTTESASISLRGSNPAQTGVFLNDVPIYDAVKFAQLSGIGTFGIFNTRLIKDVLVFPSNPPLEYGNTGAGLIGLTTDPKQESTFGEIGLGLAQSGFLAGLPVGQTGMVKMFGNWQTDALFKPFNAKAFTNLNHFRLKDIGLHYAGNINTTWRYKFFGYAISEQYNSVFNHPSLLSDYDYHKKRGFYTTHLERIGKQSVLVAKHGLSDSEQSDSVGNYRSHQTNRDVFWGLDYRYFLSEKLTIKTGYSFDSRQFNFRGVFPLVSYNYRRLSPFYSDTTSFGRTIQEIYGYMKYDFSNKITAGIGVRKNIINGSLPDYLSKQIHVRYNISKAQYINFSVGESNAAFKDSYRSFIFVKTHQAAIDYVYETDKTKIAASAYAKTENYLNYTQKNSGL